MKRLTPAPYPLDDVSPIPHLRARIGEDTVRCVEGCPRCHVETLEKQIAEQAATIQELRLMLECVKALGPYVAEVLEKTKQ